MSTSQHTCQIACDVLGQYVSAGLEDPEAPHQFPLQPPNLPTAPTPIKANTFVHILDSPTLSPSPFQFLLQEVSTQTLCNNWAPRAWSAPVSRTSPTDSRETLQQLIQALMLLGQAPPTSIPPTPSSTPATHIRSPDTFNGSNPDNL